MKVIAINKNLSVGGGELLLTLIAKETIKLKHIFDITLFEKNIQYSENNLKIKFLSPFKFISYPLRILLFPYFFISLLFIVRKYDAILTFERYPAYINVILACLLHKKSIIYVQNPIDASFSQIYKYRFIKTFHIFLHSLIFRYAKIVVVSEGIKKELIEIFGINNKKIVVSRPWIDIDHVLELSNEKLTTIEKELLSNKKIFISVGSLNIQKNFVDLIPIFHLISKKIKNSLLLIVGEGSERSNILKAIEKYNLHDKVVLLGSQNNPYKYMKVSNIFLLPSKFEGYPHVLLEAIVCELPIIATDSLFGIREIIAPELKSKPIKKQYQGKYGILVPNNKSVIKNTADVSIAISEKNSGKVYFDNKITSINNYNKKQWLNLLKSI